MASTLVLTYIFSLSNIFLNQRCNIINLSYFCAKSFDSDSNLVFFCVQPITSIIIQMLQIIYQWYIDDKWTCAAIKFLRLFIIGISVINGQKLQSSYLRLFIVGISIINVQELQSSFYNPLISGILVIDRQSRLSQQISVFEPSIIGIFLIEGHPSGFLRLIHNNLCSICTIPGGILLIH